jgi:rhodanese-related sulfurtransferase
MKFRFAALLRLCLLLWHNGASCGFPGVVSVISFRRCSFLTCDLWESTTARLPRETTPAWVTSQVTCVDGRPAIVGVMFCIFCSIVVLRCSTGATLLDHADFRDAATQLMLPRDAIATVIKNAGLAKTRPIITYCQLGLRAVSGQSDALLVTTASQVGSNPLVFMGNQSFAAVVLHSQGFKDVKVYTGSFGEWQASQQPVEK